MLSKQVVILIKMFILLRRKKPLKVNLINF